MLWLVFDDSAQDQCVTLRNKFNDKSLKLSLRIRNDDFNEFNFVKSDDHIFKKGSSASVELTLGPGCKRDVFLKFTPSTADLISRKNISSANLVIKPHGLSRPVGKITLKSTIQLQSLNYGPCRTTVYMNDERLQNQNFVKSSSKTLNFYVKNEGTCDSFFKVSILDNANDKQESSSAVQFVLEKNAEKTVKLVLKNTQCTLAVFTGPEVTRQLFKSCTSAGADSSFLLSQDFKCQFDGEKSLVQPSEFKQSDLKYFFSNIDRKVFDVQVTNELLKDNPPRRVFPEDPTFVTLIGEETEFEHTNIRTQNTIECTTQTIHTLTEESHQKSSKNAIRLERDIIAFPSVTIPNNSSVAKVTLRNRTDQVGKFHIQPLQPPFECHYEYVEVKPHFYLSVPIRFRPTRDQMQTIKDQMEYRTSIRLTNTETGEILTATLVAFSNYYS